MTTATKPAWELSSYVQYNCSCGNRRRLEITTETYTVSRTKVPASGRFADRVTVTEERTGLAVGGKHLTDGRYEPMLNCPACNKLVSGDRIKTRDSGTSKACHSRCTGAYGPSCDCPCRAVNHGSAR